MTADESGLPTRRALSQTPPVQAGILVGIGLGIAAGLIWAAMELQTLIIALIVAAFLAVGLNRPIRFMTRRGLPRWLAMTVLMVALVLLFCGGLGMLIPTAVREGTQFVNAVPGYYEQIMNSRLADRFGGESRVLEQIRGMITGGNISGLAGGLLGGAKSAAGALAWVMTSLVLALFILAGHARVKSAALNLVVASKRDRAREILDRILQQVGAYLIGALSIAALAGVSSWIFMAIAGIPYAAILAILVALTDLIPQVGATIGAVVVTLAALTVSPGTAVASLIFFVLYQQLENWAIYPGVMSNAVKVSNLSALVSVLIGATLFGVVGVILAIPFYAAIRILYRELARPRIEAN